MPFAQDLMYVYLIIGAIFMYLLLLTWKYCFVCVVLQLHLIFLFLRQITHMGDKLSSIILWWIDRWIMEGTMDDDGWMNEWVLVWWMDNRWMMNRWYLWNNWEMKSYLFVHRMPLRTNLTLSSIHTSPRDRYLLKPALLQGVSFLQQKTLKTDPDLLILLK